MSEREGYQPWPGTIPEGVAPPAHIQVEIIRALQAEWLRSQLSHLQAEIPVELARWVSFVVESPAFGSEHLLAVAEMVNKLAILASAGGKALTRHALEILRDDLTLIAQRRSA